MLTQIIQSSKVDPNRASASSTLSDAASPPSPRSPFPVDNRRSIFQAVSVTLFSLWWAVVFSELFRRRQYLEDCRMLRYAVSETTPALRAPTKVSVHSPSKCSSLSFAGHPTLTALTSRLFDVSCIANTSLVWQMPELLLGLSFPQKGTNFPVAMNHFFV